MCSLSDVTKQNYFLKTTVMQMKYLDTVCEGEPHCNITVIVGIPSTLLSCSELQTESPPLIQ